MDIFREIKKLNLPLGQYVVVGGASLFAHGLRDADDIDVVVLPELFKKFVDEGWPLDEAFEKKWGNRRVKKGKIEIHDKMMFLNREKRDIAAREIIATARLIEGIPFQSMESLLLFKKNALRPKDGADVALIEKFLKKRTKTAGASRGASSKK